MPSHFTYPELCLKAAQFRKTPYYFELVATNKLDTRGKKYYMFQTAFGFYILDIIIPSKMLIVEIDGATHLYRSKHDTQRDMFCNRCGMRVLRISNTDAHKILELIDKYNDVNDYEIRIKRALTLAKDLRNELERAAIENTGRKINDTTNYRRGAPVRKKEKYYSPEVRGDKPKRKNNLRFPKGSAK